MLAEYAVSRAGLAGRRHMFLLISDPICENQKIQRNKNIVFDHKYVKILSLYGVFIIIFLA